MKHFDEFVNESQVNESMIGNLLTNLATKTKQLGSSISRETKESIHVAKLLIRLIQGKQISKSEVAFIKSQGTDIGKSVALLGLQLVPGSSLGIIALERAGRKYGFTVFPQYHEIPESKEITNNMYKLKSVNEFLNEGGIIDWVKDKFRDKKGRKAGQKEKARDTQKERDRLKELAKKKAKKEEEKRRHGIDMKKKRKH